MGEGSVGGGSLIALGRGVSRGWLTDCSGGEGSVGVGSLIARLLVLEACVVPAGVCGHYGSLLLLTESIYNRSRS